MNKLKLFFIILTLVTISLTSSAKEKQYVYCKISEQKRFLSDKINIILDFGQETRFFHDSRFKDESGKLIKFNSVVDALNFMSEDGWIFVQAYTTLESNNSNNYSIVHYLLKKEVEKDIK